MVHGVTKSQTQLSDFHFTTSLQCSRDIGFPGGSAGKESTGNVGDLDSIPGLRRSPGKGNSYPLLYSGLENSMDYIVHRVTKSRTPLSDFHFQTAGRISSTDCIFPNCILEYIQSFKKYLFGCAGSLLGYVGSLILLWHAGSFVLYCSL